MDRLLSGSFEPIVFFAPDDFPVGGSADGDSGDIFGYSSMDEESEEPEGAEEPEVGEEPEGSEEPKGAEEHKGEEEPEGDNKRKPKKDFLAQLRGDLKFNETLSEYDGYTEICNEFLDLKKQISEGKLVSKESVGEVPESADGYEYTPPELKGVKLDDSTGELLKNMAHEMNLNQEQFKVMNESWNGLLKSSNEKFLSAKQNAVEKQKKIIEKNFGKDYSPTFNKGVLAVGGKSLLKYMKDNPLVSYHPVIVEHFHRIGVAIREDNIPQPDSNSGEKKTTTTLEYPSMD